MSLYPGCCALVFQTSRSPGKGMEASQDVQKFAYGSLTKLTDVPGIYATVVLVPVPVPAPGYSCMGIYMPRTLLHGRTKLEKIPEYGCECRTYLRDVPSSSRIMTRIKPTGNKLAIVRVMAAKVVRARRVVLNLILRSYQRATRECRSRLFFVFWIRGSTSLAVRCSGKSRKVNR